RGGSTRHISVESQQQTASSLTSGGICPGRRTCGCSTRCPPSCSACLRSQSDLIACILPAQNLQP
ncbi:unnamed protein product, partial [Closterium sp. Yama58-4]